MSYCHLGFHYILHLEVGETRQTSQIERRQGFEALQNNTSIVQGTNTVREVCLRIGNGRDEPEDNSLFFWVRRCSQSPWSWGETGMR